MTNPPPKASRAKRPLSLKTVFLERCSPKRLLIVVAARARRRLDRGGEPREEQAEDGPDPGVEVEHRAVGRQLPVPGSPQPWTSAPPASAPRAAAKEPARLYQAKTRVRRLSPTICDSADCSMEMNGPISLPLGLTTPMTAATAIRARLLVEERTPPARTINPAPSTSIRRRPMRSAEVVIQSEITMSPKRARLKRRPTVRSPKPRACR